MNKVISVYNHSTIATSKLYREFKYKCNRVLCNVSLLEKNELYFTISYKKHDDLKIQKILNSYSNCSIVEQTQNINTNISISDLPAFDTNEKDFIKHHHYFIPPHNNSILTDKKNKKTPSYGNTPAVFASYYNLPTQHGTPPTIAIISLGGTYLTSDLQHYWSTVMGLSPSSYSTVSYVQVGGSRSAPNQRITNSNSGDSFENTLDIQIISSICPKSHIIVYFGPNTTLGFFQAIQAAILGPAKIISISWGGPENSFGPSAVTSYNTLLQMAVTAGKIICVASGDSAASDGEGSTPNIDFPSSSPSVISCGGTSLVNPSNETAWSWNPTYQWGGGGGLSLYTTQPSYQTGVVPTITTSNSSINALNGNRATPDIAMNADPLSGWTIYFNGRLYTNSLGGTSCVSPLTAGFFGLCNFNYTNANMNTFLYTVYRNGTNRPLCYKDITTGSNDNVSTSGVYNCLTLYDMCTGMGSIHGTQLYTALNLLV